MREQISDEQGRCEILGATPTADDMCRKPALYRYSAMGGGYMRLCGECAKRFPHYMLERWDGVTWSPVLHGEGARDGE